jgi:hypothetical protein
VNYHQLADFRADNGDLVDRLLSEHLAALAQAGVVDLDRLAQDGVKIRASAGTGSFRRQATLDRHVATAQVVVEDLKREVAADPDASNRRIQKAKLRAARERNERLQAAQAALAKLKQQRKELEDKGGNGKKQKEPRASTTDPQARVMKMPDGGFRPGYNVQVVSVAGKQIVVTVEIGNNSSDHGSRSTVHRSNQRRTSIPIARVTATAPEQQLGVSAWGARPERRSTKLAPSANVSMPAGATAACAR